MKKLFVYMMGGIFALSLLSGCSGTGQSQGQSNTDTTAQASDASSKPDLEILNSNDQVDDNVPGLHTTLVTVRNNTNELKNYVQVNVTFFDKAGNPVGKGMGNTSNLAAGATRVVSAQAMDIENADTYHSEVSDQPF